MPNFALNVSKLAAVQWLKLIVSHLDSRLVQLCGLVTSEASVVDGLNLLYNDLCLFENTFT